MNLTLFLLLIRGLTIVFNTPCFDYDFILNKCHLCSFDHYKDSNQTFSIEIDFQTEICLPKQNVSIIRTYNR